MSDIEERIRSAVRPYRAAESVSGWVTPGRATRGLTKQTARGRTLGVVAAAAVLAAGTAVAVAGVSVFGDETPPPLEQSINDIFGGGRCVTGSEATQRISDDLAALGYDDWVIESRPGAQSDRCVVAGFVATLKQVVLLPASGPTVSAAIEGVASTLMSECLNKDQATALVTSVLSGIGQADFTINAGGPLAYPIGQEDIVRSHIAAGCFVYSATGWDANGRPVYYLSGSGA